MISNKNAFKQLSTMIILTLITQVIILVQMSIVASRFGATIQMDSYNFANSIGTFIFSFISTGITTVLIPVIINKKDRNIINNFISIIYLISVLIMIIVFLGRKYIVTTFSIGSDDFILMTCNIMLITLLSRFSQTVLGVTSAIFQCNGKYNIPKILTLVTTALLVFFIFRSKELTIYKYSFYILITNLINTMLQIYLSAKEGFKYKLIINFQDKDLKPMFKIFMPTVFSSGLYQISLLFDSMIASRLGEGQISILTYSSNIISMINMLLIGNLMTYIYPKITKSIKELHSEKRLFDYFLLFNFIMLLVVSEFVIIGKEGIALLFERGKFDASLTTLVYLCSIIYIIGLPVNVMRDVIYRYFYANGNTKETFYNSISASIINILVSIILSRFMGIYGIAIGTTVAAIFSLISIMIRFKRCYNMNFSKKSILIENGKVLLVALVVTTIILIIKNNFAIHNVLVEIFVYGFMFMIIYVLALFFIRTKVYKIKL